MRFFQQRLEHPPRWTLALGTPVLCGLLDMTAIVTLGAKNQAAVDTALPTGLPAGALLASKVSAALSMLGFPLYFVLAAMMLASADVVFRDSRRQLRLIEFAGIAFAAFLPVCLYMLVIAVVWMPPPIETLGSGVDLQSAVARYLTMLREDAWLSTGHVLYYCCLAWCAALLGVVLNVVSSFSRMGAAAAAAAVFVSLSGFWR